ncbi:MAG: cupin domain-containing protein [Chloroflexota bacterium]
MFYKSNSDGYKQVLAGIKLKTLVYGDKAPLTEFHLEQGSQLPAHSHPQEQTGYLVSGRIRLFIGDEKFGWCSKKASLSCTVGGVPFGSS